LLIDIRIRTNTSGTYSGGTKTCGSGTETLVDPDLFFTEYFPVQDPETRKQVEQYFKWEGADAQGRKFNQGKIFK
jgi:hypothetical protein